MLSIRPFDWRRLSTYSVLEHRLDDAGALRLRGPNADDAPFTTARVNVGQNVTEVMKIESLGLTWVRPDDGDGWILRTRGAPSTMTSITTRWGDLVRAAADPLGIDERFVLTTLACESGNSRPDANGYVKAPRTERGYPRRTGESDPGDLDRDVEDWQASRGAHSSHGLMQTLILVATTVRPDLFSAVDVAHYRTVLWSPANSLACGLAFLARFPASVLSDPLACRFRYGAAAAHASAANQWGIAPLYDDRVPMKFIAYWNDGATLIRGGLPTHQSESINQLLAGLLAFSAAAATAFGIAYLVRKAAT